MIEATDEVDSGWAQRLQAMIKRQPRQAAVLAALGVVLIVMWVKVVLSGRIPNPAAAATENPIPQAAVAAGDSDADRQSAHAGPRSLSEWAQQPTGPVARDLFAIALDDYPLDPAHPRPTTEQSAKSDPSQADQNKERQILIESVRAQAAHLTLEGIVLGASPRAWVNGALVGEGQAVGQTGFTVVKIEASRIFIERDGVRIALSMK